MSTFNVFSDKGNEEFAKFLDETLIQATPETLPVIMETLKADSNTLSPFIDGALRRSERVYDDAKSEGEIVYGVDYAKEKYFEGSYTGTTRWVEVAFRQNTDKYKDIIINYIKKK